MVKKIIKIRNKNFWVDFIYENNIISKINESDIIEIKKGLVLNNKLYKTILNSKNKIIAYYSEKIIQNNYQFDNIFLDAGGYKI